MFQVGGLWEVKGPVSGRPVAFQAEQLQLWEYVSLGSQEEAPRMDILKKGCVPASALTPSSARLGSCEVWFRLESTLQVQQG